MTWFNTKPSNLLPNFNKKILNVDRKHYIFSAMIKLTVFGGGGLYCKKTWYSTKTSILLPNFNRKILNVDISYICNSTNVMQLLYIRINLYIMLDCSKYLESEIRFDLFHKHLVSCTVRRLQKCILVNFTFIIKALKSF